MKSVLTADKQWEYITTIRDTRNMVVHNSGRIYKDFDKYDIFKIGCREENHQLILNIMTSLRCMMLFLILWIELLDLSHTVNPK